MLDLICVVCKAAISKCKCWVLSPKLVTGFVSLLCGYAGLKVMS